jgi:MFS family permease
MDAYLVGAMGIKRLAQYPVSSFFVLAGLGSILMGVAPNVSIAVLGRILVRIGVSTVFVCNFKLLSEWFSVRQV